MNADDKQRALQYIKEISTLHSPEYWCTRSQDGGEGFSVDLNSETVSASICPIGDDIDDSGDEYVSPRQAEDLSTSMEVFLQAITEGRGFDQAGQEAERVSKEAKLWASLEQVAIESEKEALECECIGHSLRLKLGLMVAECENKEIEAWDENELTMTLLGILQLFNTPEAWCMDATERDTCCCDTAKPRDCPTLQMRRELLHWAETGVFPTPPPDPDVRGWGRLIALWNRLLMLDKRLVSPHT